MYGQKTPKIGNFLPEKFRPVLDLPKIARIESFGLFRPLKSQNFAGLANSGLQNAQNISDSVVQAFFEACKCRDTQITALQNIQNMADIRTH